MGRWVKGLLVGLKLAAGGAVLAVTLPLCVPPEHPVATAPPRERRIETTHGAIPRAALVDLTTPTQAFRSYLDCYENRNPAGMYHCLSRRLRQCCGAANCEAFCAKMQAAPGRREGDRAVLAYYRNLAPLIETQFGACPADASRFEVVIPDPPAASPPASRPRLAFVREYGHWQLDVLEVPIPEKPAPRSALRR